MKMHNSCGWQLLRIVTCYVLITAVLLTGSTAVIVNTTWMNATVAAPTGLVVTIDTDDISIPVNATFTIQLDAEFTIAATATINTTILSETIDGTLEATIADRNKLVVTRGGDGEKLPTHSSLQLVCIGITNPIHARAITIGSLIVSNATQPSILEVILPRMLVSPGMIWNIHVQFTSLLSGRATSIVAELTPGHELPEDGAIVIYLPAIYGSSLPELTLTSITGVNGEFALSTIKNQLRLTRTNAPNNSTLSAMQHIVLQVDGLIHPLLEGPIGRSIHLLTLDADDQIIDQGDVDISDLTLTKAHVIISNRVIQVDEGEPDDAAQYTIQLSAPPEQIPIVSIDINQHTNKYGFTGVVVTPDRVYFSASNWSNPATISISSLDDHIVYGTFNSEEVITVTHTLVEATIETTFVSAIDFVQIHVEENDLPFVQLSSRYVAVVEGVQNDTYEIVLLSQPTANVEVHLIPLDSYITTQPESVLFTSNDWNFPQTVTVIGDPTEDGSTSNQISGIQHHITSSDPNYNSTYQFIVPQSQVLVYYEPLNMDACVKPCRPGWFPLVNLTTLESQCVGCPLGWYCPGQCEAPIPCPKGTFSHNAFATSISTCEACPEGSYTPLEGMESCLICPAGASCASPHRNYEPCPAGSFSDANSVLCRACPAGTYNDQDFQSSCKACPIGFYCPQNTTEPTPCTTGTYSINSGVSPCTPCPAGYACPDIHLPPTPCPTGWYSIEGETSCSVCPRGFACPIADQLPQACERGQFSSEGAAQCSACPLGYKCSTASDGPVACTLGTYSSAVNSTVCTSCPAGHSCVDPTHSPTLCALGFYSLEGDYLCRSCTRGKYCPDQYDSPISCANGTYSLGNATYCTPCPVGTDCTSTTEAPLPCAAGSYSVNVSEGCRVCPPGYYCPSVSQLPVRCPHRTYSAASGATQCSSCPFGFICVDPTDEPVPCDVGLTNNANQTACIMCPKGYECSAVSLIPTPCSLGMYSLDGEDECTPCPKGYECPLTTQLPIRCGIGSFSPTGSAECFECLAGFYCPQPSMDPIACPEWHYSGIRSTACIPCPAGMDCTSPSSPPISCRNGTYSLSEASECVKCPSGAACSDPATVPVACEPGSFSIGGQFHCTACAPGHYCPYTDQNIQLPCHNGSYAEAGATACTTCPIGKQCPSTTQKIEQTCAQGTFSLGGQSQCTPCPNGYKCPAVDGSLNEPCPLGWFSSGSAVTCTKCPAGFVCPDPKSDTLISCEPGYYSLGGAVSCFGCPAGYACPDPTTNAHIQCQAGTYSSGRSSSCTPCPAGYQCLFTNSTNFELCPPGWYSPVGASKCIQCPRGYYCDIPEEMPKNCSVGSYSFNGSTSCLTCEPGYECPRSDQLPQPCPVGYYSPGAVANCQPCYPGYKCGLASTNPTPPEDACPMGGYCNPATTFFLCPAGSFGNVTAGESVDHACAPCPEGNYCEMGSTPLTRQVCPAGYYCPEGTKRASQYPCPAGTYNPLTSQKSFDACKLCPEGSYCEEGSANPETCPHGYYCSEGTRTADQFPCPAGTYSGSQTGLILASQCKSCEIGNYCPEASITPTNCPAGTYNPETGASGLHECLDCPNGWACPHVGQSEYVDRCAKGHYCPSGTVLANANPCPAGTYTERTDLIRSEDCTICPLRHACPQGTGGETQTMLDCGAGFYCPNGTAYAKQFPCLPGTWSSSTSLADTDECNICPKGKYCSGGKSYIDGDCSPGHYCPLGTYSATQFPCPSGTYTSKTWLFEPSQCDDCPPGYYCPAGSINPIPCKPGSYTSLNNTKAVGPGLLWPECIICPAGYFCVEGCSNPEECGKGKYSAKGAKECSLCEAGYFCNSNTTTEVNMKQDLVSWATPGALYGECYNGTYCPPGADSEPALETDACPRGYFCPTATPAPIICPAGTYSNFTGQDNMDDCVPTPAGYFSLEGSLAPTGECAPGFYCPIRSTSRTQVPCPARYYLNRTRGQSEADCALCVAGAFCPKGSAYPITCPVGYYCRTGISNPEPCPIGSYSNATGLKQVEDCLLCPPGSYCDSTALTTPRGLCDPGYYCTLGAYTSAPMNFESSLFGVTTRHIGAPCPQGAYCPLGSALPTLCPAGTFNNVTGLETQTQCVLCTAGQYCEMPGLYLPTGICFAGYYCTGGATTPTQNPTPAGYFSLNGSVAPSPCPPGQFNLYAMQERCVDCPGGFYCGLPATINPTLCPTGNYCPKGTSLPVKCPPGTYANLEGLVEQAQCIPCPAGSYCDSYGLSQPSGKCFEGFFCSGSSPVANPMAQDFGAVCPVGHYCPEGSVAGVQCPNGTYRSITGGTSLSSCTLCPGGHYCSGTALISSTGVCSSGYFCTSSASVATPNDGVTGNICPAGFYCPEATIDPIKCFAGTYAAIPGQSQCNECPEGFYCDGETTDCYFDCPMGHYCPPGTTGTPVPCPVGTYSDLTKLTMVTECLECSPGLYCESEGMEEPSGPCAPGSFCPPRSENQFGKTSANETHPCPVGNYCPEGTYVPIACPRGTYSNEVGLTSTQECVFCDEGMFCADLGLVEPSGPCEAGFFCKRNNIVRNPSDGVTEVNGIAFGGNLCPKGSYCPEGSVSPKLCPEGSYTNESASEICTPCPPGYFCPLGSTGYLESLCPQGYYCPEGTERNVQYPCPPGTFGNAMGLQSISQCNPAPGGTYVDSYAATKPTGPCKSGFYCSGGSATSTPSTTTATGGPCLPGTNCPEGSAVPIVCGAGYYCSSTNTEQALPCDEGFYCIQGSYTATPTGQNNSLGMIGNVCTPGHYCPQNTSNPIPCPPGTFSYNTQNARVSDCFPCPPGFLCTTSGVVTPYEKCKAGYICTGGEREATQRCPKGYECPEGSSEPKLCPAGSFSDEIGLALCKICPERYYCEQGTITPVKCPQGYYCPFQTPLATSYPCLAGTFGNQTALAGPAECALCPPGKFCSGQSSTYEPTGDCAPGYYCVNGAVEPTPTDGVTGGLCGEGHICTGGAWLPTPTDGYSGRVCDQGYYCPEGSSVQLQCAKGTYNDRMKQSSCIVCPAGGYCDTNATTPIACPERFYCPEGALEPLLCPNGTYGHQTGLENPMQCAPCGAGKYCVGGTMTASCAAGYYCKLYNGEPNPSAHTFDSQSDLVDVTALELGGPCPIGHYCPEGVLDPEPCPNGTARLETHASRVEDCAPCPAGMNCDNGADTVACLAGWYCPYGVGALPCPAGTYNPYTGKSTLEDCLPCDAGKLCNRTGIVDPTPYDCPPGHFCLRGESSPRECPVASYRAIVRGKSAADCWSCVGGSFCGLGTVEPTVCASKFYCPEGSGEPIVCTAGSYCPYNSSTPIVCPEGYYCAMSVDIPIICTHGHYCPSGSASELPCPLGYVGRVPPLHGAYTTLQDACEVCPPGTYGIDSNRSICEICTEGYVCIGATKSDRPMSLETDNGYRCPPGYYCPAGSSAEIPCPVGTYQPNYFAINSSACLPCPENSYQNLIGQPSCLPCSTSSFSTAGATQCTCIGNHRAFQMSDGYCICEPGYEFYDQDLILRSDEDDDVDCQPIVYDRCGSNQIRSDSGSCISASAVSCEKSCNNGTGTYVTSLGLCQCDKQPDLDTICDKTCRATAIQIRVNSSTGELELYDPTTGEVDPLSAKAETSSGIVSKVSCTTDDCQLHSLSIQTGGFGGSYEIPSVVSQLSSSSSKRRRLASSSANSQLISNPMVCLTVNDGILFDLSVPQSYPIYMKDSMLNTNPSFDYGAFRALATKVKANESLVTAFAFTFTTAGTYVFGNSINSAARTVITVMKQGTSCPTEAPIVPLNAQNLISVSAKRRTDDIILAPDWGLIAGLLGGVFGMVTAIIAGLYYFRTKSWATLALNKKLAGYRAKSKQTDLGSMHSKGSVAAVNNQHTRTPISSTGITSTSTHPLPMMRLDDVTDETFDTKTATGEYEADLGRWNEEDLDLRELVDRLQFHHESVAKWFEEQKDDGKKLQKHLRAETAELKRLFVNALVASSISSAAGPSSALAIRDYEGSNPEETSQIVNNLGHDAGETAMRSPRQDASPIVYKSRFLLDNLEHELIGRKRFERRKDRAMNDLVHLLQDVENWGHHLPELTSSMISEIASPLYDPAHGHHKDEQPETTTLPISRLETIQTALGDLKALLCSDPDVMTSSSVIQIAEAEKVRREIGTFVVEASQESVQDALAVEAPTNDEIKKLLELYDDVMKAQNNEDEAFHSSLSSLHRFGAAISQLDRAVDEIETEFRKALNEVREEQNPSKERALKMQTEERLGKLLKEVAKGAAKMNAKIQKGNAKVLKYKTSAQTAEKALGAAVEDAKRRQAAFLDAERNRAAEQQKLDQALGKDESIQKLRDDTLFQIKDMLVQLTTQLHNLTTSAPTGIFDHTQSLSTAHWPNWDELTSSMPAPTADLPARQHADRSNLKKLQAAREANALAVLRKEAAQEAHFHAQNNAQIREDYAHTLDTAFPNLSAEEKERLLDDLALDLLKVESSVNVEAKKNEVELTTMLSARALLQDKQEQNRYIQQQEQALVIKAQHEQQAKQLETHFQQEEQEIENEYLQELAKLEQEFSSAVSMADESYLEELDFNDEVGDAEGPLEEPEDVSRDEDDTGNEDIIENLNEVYAAAWNDQLELLNQEQALRKKQLVKRLERKQRAIRSTVDSNADLAVIRTQEKDELAKLERELAVKKETLLEEVVKKQDDMDTRQDDAIEQERQRIEMMVLGKDDEALVQALQVAEEKAQMQYQVAIAELVEAQAEINRLKLDHQQAISALPEMITGERQRLETILGGTLPRDDLEDQLLAHSDQLLNEHTSKYAKLLAQAEDEVTQATIAVEAANAGLVLIRKKNNELLQTSNSVPTFGTAIEAKELFPALDDEAVAIAGKDFDLFRDRFVQNIQQLDGLAENMPGTILREITPELEKLKREYKLAWLERQRELENEQTARKLALSEKMKRRGKTLTFPSGEGLTKVGMSTADQEEQLSEHQQLLDEEEQQALATILSDFRSKQASMEQELQKDEYLLATALEHAINDSADEVQHLLQQCRQNYELELDKLKAALIQERNRQMSALRERLNAKKAKHGGGGVESDSAQDQEQLQLLDQSLAAAESDVLNDLLVKQEQNTRQVLANLEEKSTALELKAKDQLHYIDEELDRLRRESADAIVILNSALRAEKLRQEQRLQQRMMQRRQQQNLAEVESAEALKAEQIIQEQEQRERHRLEDHLDVQTQLAISEERDKQIDQQKTLLAQRYQALIDAAAAQATLNSIRQAKGERAGEFIDNQPSHSVQKIDLDHVAPKRRLIQRLATARKKMIGFQASVLANSSLLSPNSQSSAATAPEITTAMDALATEIERQIKEISEQHLKVWQEQQQQLKDEGALRKAQLAERMRRKRAENLKAQQQSGNPLAEEEAARLLSTEEEQELAKISIDIIDQKARLDKDFTEKMEFIAKSIEDTCNLSSEELQKRLASCQASYRQDIDALCENQRLERQRAADALRDRLIKRRQQEINQLDVGASSDAKAALENQLDEEEALQLEALDEAFNIEETRQLSNLYDKTQADFESAFQVVDKQASDLAASAKTRLDHANEEIDALRERHTESLVALEASLAAERRRQEGKLVDRLAKRREERRNELLRTGESLSDIDRLLNEEEELERVRLDEALTAQAVSTIQEQVDKDGKKENELTAKIQTLTIEVEAANAARLGLDAARRSEAERITREFHDMRKAIQGEDDLAMLEGKRRLEKRLRARRTKSKVNIDEVGNTLSLIDADVKGERTIDELSQKIGQLHDQHNRACKGLYDQLNQEARLKKAQLAEQLKWRRAELKAKASTGQLNPTEVTDFESELVKHEQDELQRINYDRTLAEQSIDQSIERQQKQAVELLVNSAANSRKEIESSAEACRQQYEEEKNKLREALEMERKRQNQLLRDRIAQRRERSRISGADEQKLDDVDEQDRQDMETRLRENETKVWSDFNRKLSEGIQTETQQLQQKAVKRLEDTMVKEQDAQAELGRVKKEHDDSLAALRAALDTEKYRRAQLLSERLRKRREQIIQDSKHMNKKEAEDALNELENEERLARETSEAEFTSSATSAIADEMSRQRMRELEIVASVHQASIDRAAAEAALKEINEARQDVVDRILQEYDANKRELDQKERISRLDQKSILLDRIAARKAKKSTQVSEPGTVDQNALITVETTDMEKEIQRVHEAHLKGQQARLEQLKLEAEMRKRLLAERMKQRRLDAQLASLNPDEVSAKEQALAEEELREIQAIEADISKKQGALEMEAINERQQLVNSVHVAARKSTEEMEALLAACKKDHLEESGKLQHALSLERQRQEQALQDRLGKKRAQRLAAIASGPGSNEAATALHNELLQEEAHAIAEQSKELEDKEVAAWKELKDKQHHELEGITEKAERSARARQEAALAEQQLAENELNRLRREHDKELKTLSASLSAQKKLQEERLRDKLAKRRADKENDLAGMEEQDVKQAQQLLNEEASMEMAQLEKEWEDQAIHALEQELKKQQEREQEVAQQINRAAMEVAAADAARKAMEAAQTAEITRIALEYETQWRDKHDTEATEMERKKQKLQDRLAEKKSKKNTGASKVNKEKALVTLKTIVKSTRSIEQLGVMAERHADQEIERLQQEHAHAWKERIQALDQEAALKKAKLADRMNKKRADMRAAASKVSSEERQVIEQSLEQEEASELREIEKDTEAERAQLAQQMMMEQQEVTVAVQDAAKKNAQEMEKLLLACKQLHEEETTKLKQKLDAERSRMEKTLQDRIAKRKQLKSMKTSASLPQEQEMREAEVLDEATERDQEANEKQALLAELDAKEKQAWEEIRRKQEEELQMLAKQAEALATKKQEEAVQLQQHAQQELSRLKHEHENEMRILTASLQADQKRQEQKLQQRIALRRELKQRDTASISAIAEQERQAQLEEEERKEKLALETELAAQAARKIEEEKERQRLEEAQVTAKIAQAAIDAAAADAAKKALEASRTLEIQRLAQEFDEKSKELRLSHEAEVMAQKKKLEARMAAKKQKKLMELEAKREMERQKLKQKQIEAEQTIAHEKQQQNEMLELLESTIVAVADEKLEAPVEDNIALSAIDESALKVIDEIDLDALQQQKDIEAIQQLFDHGLIPMKTTLMEGIELVVRRRHEQEVVLLLTRQYRDKVAAVRDGLRGLLQQKAAAKALVLSNKNASSADPKTTEEEEKNLAKIDSEYDEKIREQERQIQVHIEALHTTQSKQLKEHQLGQIAFLFGHFQSQHDIAVAKQRQEEEIRAQQQQNNRFTLAMAAPSLSKQPHHRVVYVSEAEAETEDLINDLRARLQLDADERIQQLLQEKEQALRAIDEKQQQELDAVEDQFQKLIQQEIIIMRKAFSKQQQPTKSGRADESEKEEQAQIDRLVLMLTGRKSQRITRVKKLMDQKRALLEEECKRNIQIVSAKMMQRIVEEKERLREKQELVNKSKLASNDTTLSSAQSSEQVPTISHAALEERLASIEAMLRGKFQQVAGEQQSMEEREDEHKSEPSVDAYRTSIVEGIESACRWNKNHLANMVYLDPIDYSQLELVAPEQMNVAMNARREFATYLMRLLIQSPSTDSAQLVVVVKAFVQSTDLDATPDSYFDAQKKQLYLSVASIDTFNSGQLAILVLHTLAQSHTKTKDVTDPMFIEQLYKLLVRCYQNLFQLHQQSQYKEAATNDSQQPTLSPPSQRVLPSDRQWKSRLHEMENFLKALEDAAEPISHNSSSKHSSSSIIKPPPLTQSSSYLVLSSHHQNSNKSDMDTYVKQQRKTFVQEKLDTAEKLYAQVLRQFQEQKESLEYLQEELLEMDQENEEGSSGSTTQRDTTQREVIELQQALEQTKQERDGLFEQCQSLRDEVRRLG